MSVRVLARIRPLLNSELDKDTIVTAESASGDENSPSSVIRIPNPKNEAESFSFQFQSVYDRATTQQELFDKEGMSSTSTPPRRNSADVSRVQFRPL